MSGNKKENKKQKQKITSILALIFLIAFQLAFYSMVVDKNRNLLPIRHEIQVDTFTFQEFSQEYSQKDPDITPLKFDTKQTSYQTDSVEIVEGHFGDWNIQLQLLCLAGFAIFCFFIFWCLGIHPAPFLVPLFIILTISVFYHNYLGTRIIDSVSVPVERVLCENCRNEDVKTKKCRENENCYKQIPDKYITEDADGNKIKELKFDKQKIREVLREAEAMGAFKIYPEIKDGNKKVPIELNSPKNPTREDSNINKYSRASADSKKHFRYIWLGLFFFLLSIVAAKCFSKVDNLPDILFRGVTFLLILFCIVGALSIRQFTLVELLKLFAIVLTVIGYEKINKNNFNKWLYIFAIIIEIGVLVYFFDFGNLLILLTIIWSLFFLTLPLGKWKKIVFPILLIMSAVAVFVLCWLCDRYLEYELETVDNLLERILPEEYMPEKIKNLKRKFKTHPMTWRISDTGDGLTTPLCSMTVNGKNGEWSYSFYTRDRVHQICDNDENTGFYDVKECKNKPEETECDATEVRTCILENGKPANCENVSGVESKEVFIKEKCKFVDKRCSRKDDENEKISFYKVQNCEDKKAENECSVIKECKKEGSKIRCTEKDSERKKFYKEKCRKESPDCNQVNTDPRLAMFAVLKDGFGGGSTGFKENTFLLNNKYMYTDFVFLGLIAFFGIWITFLVVLCLFVLIWKCNVTQEESGDNYKHFLYSNIMVVIFGAQAIIHIGGNLNIIPFTGVTLPFLSRGGASTVVSFITLGLALGGLVSDDSWLFDKLVLPIFEGLLLKPAKRIYGIVEPIVEKIEGRFGGLRKKRGDN